MFRRWQRCLGRGPYWQLELHLENQFLGSILENLDVLIAAPLLLALTVQAVRILGFNPAFIGLVIYQGMVTPLYDGV